jgi:two-component system CheB/CheR fusion protein
MNRVPERVLLIEDDVEQAEALKGALVATSRVIEVARSGAEGIEKARSLHPDIVICDIGLPDIEGYEVARQIRADPILRSSRLVALTVEALPEDRERSRRAGFDEHLAKPPSFEVLDQEITKAVQGRART